MHIMGKVFLWLMAVVLIPAAVLLTTMTLDIRSKWQAEIKQRQEKLATSTQQLNQVRAKVTELEGQLQRNTFDWGQVWDAPQSQPLPAGNGVQLGVGRSRGLGRNAQPGKAPRIYAFAEAGDQSTYIGELELVQIDADRAAGQLIRPPYPGEAQSWPRGKYRVRDTLPANWLSTVADLESQTTVAASKLGFQREEETIFKKQLAASQASLDQRLAELNGDANAPSGASQQVLDGFVETLRKLENQRNETLHEVHALRVKLVKDFSRLEKTLASNRKAVSGMTTVAAPAKPAVVLQPSSSGAQ